jgi:hypothetical protein
MAGLDPATQLASVCERKELLARKTARLLGGRLKGGHGGEGVSCECAKRKEKGRPRS